MVKSPQTSISSSLNDFVDPKNLSNQDIQDKLEEIPEWQKCSNKRFKNLVECYLCKVDDCQILFETKEELSKHKNIHSKLYKCDFPNCGKNFMKIINLRKHTKCHFKNKKKYFCTFEGCKKSFTASYSLTLHYRIHSGTTPFKCEKCGQKFFNRANYQYHINNMHKKLFSKKLVCSHHNCGHKSKSIKQLLMHHDKLEEQCVKEKNSLLKLIIFYQNATISLLKYDKNKKMEEFDQHFGVDEEKTNIWIDTVNSCDLDEELKKEVNLIEIQSKNIINNSKDKNKYQGILGKF